MVTFLNMKKGKEKNTPKSLFQITTSSQMKTAILYLLREVLLLQIYRYEMSQICYTDF